MNKERRAVLADALTQLSQIKTTIEEAMEAEQEYFDNMPEALQSGDKGDKAVAAVEALEAVVDTLEQAEENITTAME